MSLVQAQQGEPRKKTVLDGLFSIQSEGLVWNHDAVVYVIAVGVWHHASACIFLRIDYIHHFVMMPYRRQAADFIHGFAVIYELQFRPTSTKNPSRKTWIFLSIAKAMVYHHRKVYIISLRLYFLSQWWYTKLRFNGIRGLRYDFFIASWQISKFLV